MAQTTLSSGDGRSPRTAFVLAGGGSLGAVEVGMLQALLDWGETPTFVVGASAGAINAAYFATEPTRTCTEKLERLWCMLKRRDVLPFNILGVLRRRGHLVDSYALRRLLERHLPYQKLEHAALPVHIVASDMLTGHEVLLSSGPVIDAVLASTAIPGVFPPVQIGSQWLVDGGVANNTPISTAMNLGATRIVVLPTGFACALNRPPPGAVARAMHALSLLVSRQLAHDAERFTGARIQLRIVPSLCPLNISAYDYSAAASLITQARASTHQWLAAGGLDRDWVPDQLHDHHHG
ncbi:patatin-like phospholipase family protein [Dyella koreensis]|uniref:Patatin-like phospholipase family protein n=1 Tax=Dyella koreensis TaxID=311235 RepID=A0ABW8K9W7_9GAMM